MHYNTHRTVLFGRALALLAAATAGVLVIAGCSGGSASEHCDHTKRPIMFVHGVMGGGDNFELQAERFTSNGYCRSSIRAFDYDAVSLAGPLLGLPAPPAGALDDALNRLDTAVDALRADTGFDKVDLVGHSFGTYMSDQYMSDPARAAKIAHYAQAAGFGTAEPVPQVNLSSAGDMVAGLHTASDGPNGTPAENPDIGYHDHLAVLTCQQSFAAMYEFFDGMPPAHPDVVPESHVEVSGFYKNFSDNTPHAGITIDIYEVDPDTGQRLRTDPDYEFVTGSDGSWGPFVAMPDARYEFYQPEAGQPPAAGEPGRPQHIYRGPFIHSTNLMYLKGFPMEGSLAAALIGGQIQYTDAQAGLVILNTHRAMISQADPGGHGTDTLTVNGSELLTAEVAPESKTLIALFAFDGNSNGQSDLTAISGFVTPFLNGIDISLPTSDSSPIELVYDGFTLHVPRWKSDTEGDSLIMLDN